MAYQYQYDSGLSSYSDATNILAGEQKGLFAFTPNIDALKFNEVVFMIGDWVPTSIAWELKTVTGTSVIAGTYTVPGGTKDADDLTIEVPTTALTKGTKYVFYLKPNVNMRVRSISSFYRETTSPAFTYHRDHTISERYLVAGIGYTATPTDITTISVSGNIKPGGVASLSWGISTHPYDPISYIPEVSINGGSFTSLPATSDRQTAYTIPSNANSVTFRVRARAGNNYSSFKMSAIYNLNTVPTITLSSPSDARTLYENDTLSIAGNVTDTNVGDVVSVKFSINGGAPQAITAIVSTGSAASFAKNLTYKSGKLYDGNTALTDTLVEGSQHSVKIWAEDDKGGKSAEITRTFYVVPNRAASLTLDAFVMRTGLIDTDVVNIVGNVADLDNGNVIVKYKIGNGAFVQVFNGVVGATPTPFNFNVLVGDLADGDNQLTIQAVDAYNAISQHVLNVRKSKNEVPLMEAVTYYEITPPNGAADGLQLYVEREVGDLVVKADIFMGSAGQSEVFVPMTLASTANLTNGHAEDTFTYEHSTDAAKIVVRIKMTRTSAASNKAIKKISGVLT